MYNVQCVMYNVSCNVQCVMYNVSCTMYNVQCRCFRICDLEIGGVIGQGFYGSVTKVSVTTIV